MTRIITYVSGIYPYSRNHSLAARMFGRATISRDDLLRIMAEDSQRFISKQKELALDFISDGQFLWMDYARPFSLSNKNIEEENLEMTRKSDTNTFIRRPNIDSLEDLKNTKLADFLPGTIENRSVKVYGPYTFAKLSISNGFSVEDLMTSYSEALAENVTRLANDNSIGFLEITEPLLVEQVPNADLLEHTKNSIAAITRSLNGVQTNLSMPYNSVKPVWKELLEFPVKCLTVDMRARDYFNIIPEAERIVEDYSFLLDYDIQKTLFLGCVNGRNGGFTPGKGLETPEWVADVVSRIRNKVNTDIGITFSTDEVIVPRALADRKLENIAKAKAILGGAS